MVLSSSRSWTKEYYLGTQMPYYYAYENEVCPPNGYHPVYIHYLGRHGGRYLMNPEGTSFVCEVLEEAFHHHELTLRGLELYGKVIDIMESESERENSLTRLGSRALEEIAHRVYDRYPKVFGRRVLGESSYKKRATDSLKVFLAELSDFVPKGTISVTSRGWLNPILCFYENNPDYLKYKEENAWNKKRKNKQYDGIIAKNIANRIFRQGFFERSFLEEEKLCEWVNVLFQLYTNQFDTNGVLSIGYFFTQKEKEYYWKNKNIREFYEIGPGAVGNHITTESARPLFFEIARCADRAINGKDISAQFWFGHSATIVPFVSFLGIAGCSRHTDSLEEVCQIWKDYEISPVAANLQWIFYEGPKDILVQIKFNEKTVRLPIASAYAPFYSWQTIKENYME